MVAQAKSVKSVQMVFQALMVSQVDAESMDDLARKEPKVYLVYVVTLVIWVQLVMKDQWVPWDHLEMILTVWMVSRVRKVNLEGKDQEDRLENQVPRELTDRRESAV